MKIIDYNTRLFKNIFASYDDFKKWYASTPLSDNEIDVPSEKTFTLIAYEYNDSHVNMSPESFKQHFANDLYTYYKEFEETTKSIKDLLSLTDEEVAQANTVINNIAVTPEVENSTNAEEVDFISQQQKTIVKKGKLQIKREQLANKRTLTTKKFLARFKHLFINILSPAYVDVYREKEGE